MKYSILSLPTHDDNIWIRKRFLEMPIDKTFAYHKPTPEGLRKINALREAYTNLSRAINDVCPASRELSEAKTCLETSSMFAIKSIVSNDPGSEVE